MRDPRLVRVSAGAPKLTAAATAAQQSGGVRERCAALQLRWRASQRARTGNGMVRAPSWPILVRCPRTAHSQMRWGPMGPWADRTTSHGISSSSMPTPKCLVLGRALAEASCTAAQEAEGLAQRCRRSRLRWSRSTRPPSIEKGRGVLHTLTACLQSRAASNAPGPSAYPRLPFSSCAW